MGVRKDSPEELDRFVRAYTENRCLFTTTCEILGHSPKVVYEWRQIHPEFDAALTKAEHLLREKIEGSLVNDAVKEGGAPVSKIFYLKNNWKEKYGDKQVFTVEPGKLWFEQKPAIEGEEITKQLEDGKMDD